MTPEQIAYDYDEQPESEDEQKYREDVGYKIAESEAFCEEEHCDSPCSLDRPVAGVASGLRSFCCLRYASDPCGRNSCTAPLTRQRTHPFACRVAARGTRRKLSRTAHGESATCRFDMRGPRLQLVHAIDLPVDAFQRSGEHLFALQGMFGCAWKAFASPRPFAACFAALFARQSPFLVAHIAQPLAQRPEVIKPGIIDFGMVTAQDDLMLIVAENVAFEFAGYGHDYP